MGQQKLTAVKVRRKNKNYFGREKSALLWFWLFRSSLMEGGSNSDATHFCFHAVWTVPNVDVFLCPSEENVLGEVGPCVGKTLGQFFSPGLESGEGLSPPLRSYPPPQGSWNLCHLTKEDGAVASRTPFSGKVGSKPAPPSHVQ